MSDFKTSELRDTSQELQELREQLAAVQEAAEFNFQQYQDAGRLLCEAQAEIDRLKSACKRVGDANELLGTRVIEAEKVASASQAREQQLREACACADWNSLDLPEFTRVRLAAALRLPSDTTALEAMIAKAGGVMRKNCMSALRYQGEANLSIIRTIPFITLKDLK